MPEIKCVVLPKTAFETAADDDLSKSYVFETRLANFVCTGSVNPLSGQFLQTIER